MIPSELPTESSADTIRQAAMDVFGFPALRPGQLEVISDVLSGHNVVTVMPTGAGKSLCYQLPAVHLRKSGGVALVVSPLIALMKDQVDSLRARGIDAAALTSASGPDGQAEILAGMQSGEYAIVYVAPERFRSPRFLNALAQVRERLSLLAIDEAHCISAWGHDFRPDYRRLGRFIEDIEPPRLIALTATATPEVRRDIAEQLHMVEPRFYVRGFDRPNLFYVVERAGGAADKSSRLVKRVRERKGGVALVYAATRKNAERYGESLQLAGLRVRVYHAGLEDKARTSAQEAFMDDKLDVIVATNAFGMGVDKSDIRLVIHADLPRSPEAYYQEAGRGGRDGDDTGCVLLFNHADVRLQEFLIDTSFPSSEVLRGLWKVLRDRPELGHRLERLRYSLPGPPPAASVKSAVRILKRHGFLRDEGDMVVACRPPDPDLYPPLDVDELTQRSEVERRKLRTMIEYAYYPRCRRQFILEYFGDQDWRKRDQRCTGCDNCLGAGQAQPLKDEQKRAIVNLLCLVRRLSGRFGRTKLAALANGGDDDQRFLDLAERGTLREYKDRELLDLLRALEGAQLVDVSRGEYPVLSITERGAQAAEGKLDLDDVGVFIPLRKQRASKPRRASSKSSRRDTAAAVGESLEPLDEALVERLTTLRRELASEKAVPAYIIFSNRTLEAIARARPSSEAELAAVPGIGPSRLEAYGEYILTTVKGR